MSVGNSAALEDSFQDQEEGDRAKADQSPNLIVDFCVRKTLC